MCVWFFFFKISKSFPIMNRDEKSILKILMDQAKEFLVGSIKMFCLILTFLCVCVWFFFSLFCFEILVNLY